MQSGSSAELMSPLEVGVQTSKALDLNYTSLAIPKILEISSKWSNKMLGKRERKHKR